MVNIVRLPNKRQRKIFVSYQLYDRNWKTMGSWEPKFATVHKYTDILRTD
jgi:hypothetical protein